MAGHSLLHLNNRMCLNAGRPSNEQHSRPQSQICGPWGPTFEVAVRLWKFSSAVCSGAILPSFLRRPYGLNEGAIREITLYIRFGL